MRPRKPYPVKCRRCGDTIRFPDGKPPHICYDCAYPRTPSVGGMGSGHWDDDESGASGSWDNVVRMYEEGSRGFL